MLCLLSGNALICMAERQILFF